VLVKYAYAPTAATTATASVARRARPFFDLMNFIATLPEGIDPPRDGCRGVFERGRDDAPERAFSLPLPSRA
jgi:hypothetical protein